MASRKLQLSYSVEYSGEYAESKEGCLDERQSDIC
jgi:hypothetical protein